MIYMKKVFCIIIMFIFLTSVGCQTATGYPQFDFGDFDSFESIAILYDSRFSYLRCGGCSFIPKMRAITHENFVVDFLIYANNADILASFRSIELMLNDHVIIYTTLDESVTWEKTDEGTFRGSIRALTIPMDSVEFIDGDIIQIRLCVSVEDNEKSYDGVLLFDGVVWQYTTVVFPV